MTIMARRCEESQLIVIPVEDDLIHTNEYPFCSDLSCPCHEDTLLLSDVAQAIEQGLLTPDEATLIVQGKTL